MDAGTKRGLVPVKFLIDPVASRFTVQAFATGMLSSFGHNPTMGFAITTGKSSATLKPMRRRRSGDGADQHDGSS
jgi:hypothetical protein